VNDHRSVRVVEERCRLDADALRELSRRLDGSVLAEVADEEGRTLEILTVPNEAARSLGPRNVPERPETSQSVPRSDDPDRPHDLAFRESASPRP
jgi:hypothetical protein